MSNEKKIKELLESEEVRDFNGINPVIRSAIREINKEDYPKRKNAIKQDPELFINIFYEEELDSIIVRILCNGLSITNQFCPVFINKLTVEDWINKTINYIVKTRNLIENNLLEKEAIIIFMDKETKTLKTHEISEAIYNYIYKLSIRITKNNLEIYKEIMKKYQNGDYGNQHLSLNEILIKAGEPDLLSQMSIEELDELINNPSEMFKELFINLKNEKIQERILTKNQKNKTDLFEKKS